MSSRRRTAVAYIDGFNFYYGAVRQHPDLKWVNLEVLCERLLGRGHELVGVTYCTARVSATVTDPQAPERQQRYLRALSGLPRIKVLTGTFMTKTITRPLARGPRKGKRVEVVTWEEKGSDVNLATELVLDTCDRLPGRRRSGEADRLRLQRAGRIGSAAGHRSRRTARPVQSVRRERTSSLPRRVRRRPGRAVAGARPAAPVGARRRARTALKAQPGALDNLRGRLAAAVTTGE